MILTFETHNDTHIDIVGTCLQGYLNLPRTKLVELFGEPNEGSSDGKTHSEWHLKLIGGDLEEIVVNIYDYKTPGANRDTFSDWHIGGASRWVVYELADLLIQLGVGDPDTVWRMVTAGR